MQSDVVYSSETTQFGRNNKNFFCSPEGKRGNERRGMLITNKNLQRIINKVAMKQEEAPSPAAPCLTPVAVPFSDIWPLPIN